MEGGFQGMYRKLPLEQIHEATIECKGKIISYKHMQFL
jgi:hypothetical protein